MWDALADRCDTIDSPAAAALALLGQVVVATQFEYHGTARLAELGMLHELPRGGRRGLTMYSGPGGSRASRT